MLISLNMTKQNRDHIPNSKNLIKKASERLDIVTIQWDKLLYLPRFIFSYRMYLYLCKHNGNNTEIIHLRESLNMNAEIENNYVRFQTTPNVRIRNMVVHT